jgi:aspartyl/asparaginyl-tRNA synthetase
MKKKVLGNTDLEASTHYLRCVQLLGANRIGKGANTRSKFIDKTVSLSGTIKTIRKQKHGAFAHVTDGSCLQPVQVVLDPELAGPYVSLGTRESVVTVLIHESQTKQWYILAN